MEPALEHERLEHVSRYFRAPQRPRHTRAALAPAEQHEVAHARSPTGAALQREAPAALEHRLGDEEAAALGEDRHPRLRESASARRGPRRRAHRDFA